MRRLYRENQGPHVRSIKATAHARHPHTGPAAVGRSPTAARFHETPPGEKARDSPREPIPDRPRIGNRATTRDRLETFLHRSSNRHDSNRRQYRTTDGCHLQTRDAGTKDTRQGRPIPRVSASPRLAATQRPEQNPAAFSSRGRPIDRLVSDKAAPTFHRSDTGGGRSRSSPWMSDRETLALRRTPPGGNVLVVRSGAPDAQKTIGRPAARKRDRERMRGACDDFRGRSTKEGAGHPNLLTSDAVRLNDSIHFCFFAATNWIPSPPLRRQPGMRSPCPRGSAPKSHLPLP